MSDITSRHRDQSADIVKGVAIALMVYGHVTHSGSLSGVQNHVVNWIYTYHMPVFLILSGVFFKFNQNTRESLKRVSTKLIRPYVAFSAIYLLALFGVHSLTNATTSNLPPTSLLEALEIILLRPRGGYWFLHTLIVMQLSFLSGAVIAKHALGKVNAIFYGLLICLISSTLGVTTARSVFFFVAGVILSEIHPAGLFPMPWYLCIAGLSGVLALGGVPTEPLSSSTVIWVFCWLFLSLSVARRIQFSLLGTSLSWLGRNSLLVLVVHSGVVLSFRPIRGWLLQIDSTGLVFSLSCTVMAILLPVYLGLILDRLGISSLLFGTTHAYSPIHQRPFESRR